MASTGEVASFGTDVHEAYWASLLSTTGFRVPRANSGVLIGGDTSQPEMTEVAKGLADLGFKLYCTSLDMEAHLQRIPHVRVTRIRFPSTDKRHLREVFDEHDIQCVINLARGRPRGGGAGGMDEDYVA